MNNRDYQPNSHKSKAESTEVPAKKVVNKVVSGKVRTKRNDGRKLADIFIADDVKDVKSYILLDIVVPAIKRAIVSTVEGLFGEPGPRKGSTNASYVSYRNYSDNRNDRLSPSDNRTRTGYSYNDIILDSRGEAEEVLSRMDELVETYGEVTVADLYDLVGITGEWTDNRYGWTNIKNAEVVRARNGGYLIRLPKALPITR